MLVAITGASGFIGRHLVDPHAKRGDRVRVLIRASSPGTESGYVETIVSVTYPGLISS